MACETVSALPDLSTATRPRDPHQDGCLRKVLFLMAHPSRSALSVIFMDTSGPCGVQAIGLTVWVEELMCPPVVFTLTLYRAQPPWAAPAATPPQLEQGRRDGSPQCSSARAFSYPGLLWVSQQPMGVSHYVISRGRKQKLGEDANLPQDPTERRKS